MKRWKPYPHLTRKATLEELSEALDALPEAERALYSDTERRAYKKASYRTMWMMGWEWQLFLDALSDRILTKE